MPAFDVGTIVRVPFPYTDRETRQRRPAVVVSATDAGGHGLVWVLMITSAANRHWADDIALGERTPGLPVPSLVRTAKIATIDADAAEEIGRLSSDQLAQVRTKVAARLGLRLA